MSSLCRNPKMYLTRRFKSLLAISTYLVRGSHTSWKTVPCPVQRVPGVPIGNLIESRNFICRRQFQIFSNLHNEDVVTSQLTSGSTAESILVTLNSIDVLTPPQIVAAFDALDKLTFAQLMVQPWAIYADHTLLFVQSHINSEAREIYDPVLQCPEFDRLCYEAQKCRTAFSNSELVSVTRCMTRLHVDMRSDVFRNMLYECQVRREQFDLPTLTDFAEIGNFVKRPGFILCGQIVRVLQNQWDDIEMSEQNFLSIIKLLHTVGYFMTEDTLLHYQKKILQMLKIYQQSILPEKLLDLLEALTRFSGHTEPEITKMVMLGIKSRLDEVNLWHLPRITYQLFHDINGGRSELMGMLRSRVSSILTTYNDTLRPADAVALTRMSHLMNCPSLSKDLEFVLKGQMANLDVLLLKYVSGSNQMPLTTNDDLILAFSDQVQQKLEDLLKSLSCLLTVTHCLAKISVRPPEFDRVYSHHLMLLMLNHQLGTQPKHLAAIGRYLVQCYMRLDLRSVGLFSTKLIHSLPHMTLIDIANISLGIRSFDNLTVRSNYEQLITNFAREILFRSDEIENIAVLNLLVKSVFTKLNGPFREAVISELEELYVKHAPSLTLKSVKPTCSLLRQLRMHIAIVCDRIVEIITNERGRTEISLSDMAHVLDFLVRVNYFSSGLETVQEMATKKISKVNCLSASEMKDVLLIANSLASFHMFPEDIIKRVFSLNFLMCLDTWMASKTSFSRSEHKYLYTMLSDLNRSVMLQCPQLGESVSWFCDHFSKRSDYKIDSHAIVKWKGAVQSGLEDALGGHEYVRLGPLLSPYNLSYDFECFLDEDRKPLPVQTGHEHNRYRVAVLLLTPSNYCTNTKTLNGQAENKVAQLEVLGFKVVALPYFHMDSMMLNDLASRQKYFYDKVVEVKS